ncbi:hypothetical protein EYF80_031422 [Liparis tanakae]|uniref:Uncharacterized protein n=1 Tax=Liparis tanakae TaxID=230148 RepID=A0A4Z2GY33_9TELE|nr:hypothetical protein EYF80_031422 [Liparis tanakae]
MYKTIYRLVPGQERKLFLFPRCRGQDRIAHHVASWLAAGYNKVLTLAADGGSEPFGVQLARAGAAPVGSLWAVIGTTLGIRALQLHGPKLKMCLLSPTRHWFIVHLTMTHCMSSTYVYSTYVLEFTQRSLSAAACRAFFLQLCSAQSLSFSVKD